MNIYKHLLLDWLGRRQSGHPVKRRRDIESLPKGCSVAIVHTNDKLGDAVIRSAFLSGLRRSRLSPRQIVITTPRYAEYWQCFAAVDQVLVVPNRLVDGTLRTAPGLTRFILKHRRQFDVLVNFDQFCRVGEFSKVAFLDSKINIGFGKEMFTLFDYSIPRFIDGSNLRTPEERTKDLLALFGVESCDSPIEAHVPLGRSNLMLPGNAKPRVLVNAYGQLKTRSFDLEALIKLIDIVVNIDSCAEIYLNLPPNHSYANESRLMRERLHLVDPFSSLWEFFDFVSQMDAVITPDTGAAHVAAGLDKPLFVCFTNDYYVRQAWLPMSNDLEYVCSEKIESVNEVNWDSVHKGIARTLARAASSREQQLINV